MKLLNLYLTLDKEFVIKILNQSLTAKDFWNTLKLKLNAPNSLRRKRGYEEFEQYFGINILNQIQQNQKQFKQQKLDEIFSQKRICKNPKCKKEFSWKDTSRSYSNFCSKKCAASYSSSFVNTANISNTLKNCYHDIRCAGGCGKILHTKISVSKKFCNECLVKVLNYNLYCQYCGKPFLIPSTNKTCCYEHGKMLNAKHNHETNQIRHSLGGKRQGSGRGKHGLYKGIWCDSSWELAWVIYNLEHGISFTRYHGYFEYEFDGKKHKYYPDFQLEDGTIVEIKGYESKQWQAKLDQFPSNLTLVIIGKNEIQPYLKYAKQQYGENFISQYNIINGSIDQQ